MELIEARPPQVELVITGRRASPAVIERADLVTEMREVKHYYRQVCRHGLGSSTDAAPGRRVCRGKRRWRCRTDGSTSMRERRSTTSSSTRLGLRSLRDAARMLAVGYRRSAGGSRTRRPAERLPDACRPLAHSAGRHRGCRGGAPALFAAADRRPDEAPGRDLGRFRRRAPGMPKISAAERRERIIELLDEHQAVRVSSLSTVFGVSQMTIRRDLDHLDLEGLARRAHGGAIARR